jgi:glycerol-3-phosphate responsive antiterminator
MASSSNTSSDPRYIVLTRMDQEVKSRMILLDFATLDKLNATIVANDRKDFITMLAGLPPSQVENLIAQSNKHVITQATIIAEVRERNSALMMEGSDLPENNTNSDKESALTQQ